MNLMNLIFQKFECGWHDILLYSKSTKIGAFTQKYSIKYYKK